MTEFEGSNRDKRRRAKQQERKRQQEADIRFLLTEPAGRRFVRRIIEETGVMRSIAPGAAADMAFVAGRRDVGLWLITQIVTAEPLSYSQLLAEHAKEFMDNVNGNDSSDDN